MLRLLHMVSLRQLRASWARAVLIIGGIASGVALIVAIDIVNASVLSSLKQTIEHIAGPAQLEVTLGVGELGFREETVKTVRDTPGVEFATPLVRGTISLADGKTTPILQLFGVDFGDADVFDRYPVQVVTDRGDILTWMADPRSIALTTTFAEPRKIALGSKVKLSTPAGLRDFTVRGLLQPEGFARALGGQLALMDLPAAQLLLGKDGLIDQIDIVVRPDADVGTVQAALRSALPNLSVDHPIQRGAEYESILSAFQFLLTGISLFCLVAGIYIIYNTTSTEAVHRAFVVAGLRLTGAEPAQLFRLLMLEALVLGALGSALGVGGGIVLARLLTGMVSDSMGVIFQLRFPVEALDISAERIAVGTVIGIAAALFASYFAARRVTRLDPLDVLRVDLIALAPKTRTWTLVGWWLAMVAVTAVALVLEVRFKSIAWGNFGSTVWNAAAIVIAIPIVSGLAPLLSRVLSRLFGAEGRMATESLFRSSTRTGVTVAAIALVLLIGITLSSLTLSFRRSVERYFERGGLALGDVVVSAVSTEGGWLETPLPESLADELRPLAGVTAVDMYRVMPGQMYHGQRITLFALSDSFFDPARYGASWYREGDAVRAAGALRTGEGVNVSVSLADRFGLHVGDQMELPDTPSGRRFALPIVGIVWDYMSDRGTVILNRRVLADYWLDHNVSRFNLVLARGASPEAVKSLVQDTLSDRYRLAVRLPRDLLDYHAAAIDRAFAFTDAIQLLVIVVTVAGIFDLLLAAVWERRRELALWRVIGADERSVRRSVVIESGTIGVLGALLGVIVGVVSGWIWVGINFRYLLGYHLDYHFAVGATLWYIALAMVMTMLAGYGAARHATRQSVLDGIQTE